VSHEAKRSKVVGIILAFLLGPISWIYTWKFDSWKFWVNLVLILPTLGLWLVIAWVWAIVDMIFKDKKKFVYYYYD